MKWFGVLPSFGLNEFTAGVGRATASVGAANVVSRDVPFEERLLERYYLQVLLQYKVTFWFSLVFAAVGFGLIAIGAFQYFDLGIKSAVSRLIAGIVGDAVAALFFVQSRWAQRTMRDFSEKLRQDRRLAETRKLCESIESPEQRDALRIRLALQGAEVENAHECASSIWNMPRTPSDASAPPGGDGIR